MTLGPAPIRPAAAPWRAAVLRLDHGVTQLSLAVACALMVVVSGLGIWQVLTRFILSQPSTWTEEIMRRLLIWMVMLGVVVAFRRGALISVDLMLRLSRGTWRRFVRGLISAVSLAFLGVLVWYGANLAWRVRFQTFASIELSMAWAYAALPVGAALAIVGVLGHHFDPIDDELDTAV